MKKIMALTVVVLATTIPGRVAGQGPRGFPPDWDDRVPFIGGVWYLNGDWDSPCKVIQRRPDGRALFINENGSRAWGTIRGDRVWIPKWTDGRRKGLRGRIRGDRIIWPGGSYWSR